MNFCDAIVQATLQHPQRMALSIPNAHDRYQTNDEVTYQQLLDRAASIQSGLAMKGFQTGDRILIIARPSIALYALVIALLGAGMAPVLIDRGMSRHRMLSAIKSSHAKAAIGEAALLRLWWFMPPLWRIPLYALDSKAIGVTTLPKPIKHTQFECLALPSEHHGLITFTSGSTGQPKGADRTHKSLIEQHHAIRDHWPDRPDDLDSPCFPVLVLHNLCCGISTLLPATDLAHPGQVNAAAVLNQLQQYAVTRIACAPAYLTRLVTIGLATSITLPAIRSVVIGGSTMPDYLARHVQQLFPNAQIRIVYGSTEAEPIADIDLTELLSDWQAGQGHLVGRPTDKINVVIIPTAPSIECASQIENHRPQVGCIGEIIVSGAHVLQGYVDNPQANKENKIPRPDGGVWHRTGDVGYFDDKGRIWLVGRMRDALYLAGQPFYTFPVEKALDNLPSLQRSALLPSTCHDKKYDSVLVIQGDPVIQKVIDILHQHGLQNTHLYQIKTMPLDGRHNSKIDRASLINAIRNTHLKPKKRSIVKELKQAK